MKNRPRDSEQGFVLISVILMLAVLMALLGAYSLTSQSEVASGKLSRKSSSGFYTAEAGLNLRAEAIRSAFLGYNRPTGTSPTATGACNGINTGDGDFACEEYTLGNRTAVTYIEEEAGNPVMLTIPPGEKYQNLNAQEYRYTAKSLSEAADGTVEALLELKFKSRLVPLFQFAAFYNKDLEILPGPNMTLAGPVHTNGDLYLNSDALLTVNGQITTSGNLYRGRKNTTVCNSSSVAVFNPLTATQLLPTCPQRTLIQSSVLTPFNNMIQKGVTVVTVPSPEVLTPTPGQVYWDKADLRLVLRLTSTGALDTTYAATGIEVRNSDNSVNTYATGRLNNSAVCTGTLTGSRVIGTTDPNANTGTFYNARESKRMRLLDVQLQPLLNCLHTDSWFGTGKLLSDDTEGGLVFHFSISGPETNNSANRYGVRIRSAAELRATASGAPTIKGMTIVTDQAAYLMGNFNATNKKPAAVLADSFNILSNSWNDANSWTLSGSTWGPGPISGRVASNTTTNLAVLAGTDTTGGVNGEGAAGQGGAYNGGLENYPRFHENWSGRTHTYAGSWVSLNRPTHVTGTWAAQSYNPPARAWSYDTSFNNAANLPPITPRFVYLRQELFVRDFEQQLAAVEEEEEEE